MMIVIGKASMTGMAMHQSALVSSHSRYPLLSTVVICTQQHRWQKMSTEGG